MAGAIANELPERLCLRVDEDYLRTRDDLLGRADLQVAIQRLVIGSHPDQDRPVDAWGNNAFIER
jgi:hypothetical protein